MDDDISIHASRVGGDQRAESNLPNNRISIHASRVGGDDTLCSQTRQRNNISIHASRVGGDDEDAPQLATNGDFNPRLPGGRRRGSPDEQTIHCHFNPRLPGGRRPYAESGDTDSILISIHASRVGGDDWVREGKNG